MNLYPLTTKCFHSLPFEFLFIIHPPLDCHYFPASFVHPSIHVLHYEYYYFTGFRSRCLLVIVVRLSFHYYNTLQVLLVFLFFSSLHSTNQCQATPSVLFCSPNSYRISIRHFAHLLRLLLPLSAVLLPAFVPCHSAYHGETYTQSEHKGLVLFSSFFSFP